LQNNSFELYSVIKLGATTNELKESAKEEINRLSYDDVIIISYSANDHEANNFSLTLQNIINFIKSNNQTNIILVNLPYRYDLHNSTTVNNAITILNRKLQKLLNAFPHTNFLETDHTRTLFTNHGLHLNKLGKQLVNCQIASLLYSTCEKKSSPIMLGWYEIQDCNYSAHDDNQVKSLTRNSSRNKKLPVMRSNDFL
jgi:hypothetical protein